MYYDSNIETVTLKEVETHYQLRQQAKLPDSKDKVIMDLPICEIIDNMIKMDAKITKTESLLNDRINKLVKPEFRWWALADLIEICFMELRLRGEKVFYQHTKEAYRDEDGILAKLSFKARQLRTEENHKPSF